MNTNVSKHDLNYFWSQATAWHHLCGDKKSGGFVVAALGVRMPFLTPLLTAGSAFKHVSCHSIWKIKTAVLCCHWGESTMATFSLVCELLRGERWSGVPATLGQGPGGRPACNGTSVPPGTSPQPAALQVATGRARLSRCRCEAAQVPKSGPGPGGLL